jgi:hypothetical protein
MGSLSLEEIEKKIENCYSILSSKLCIDRLYIIFVVCEYLRYKAAFKDSEHHANSSSIGCLDGIDKSVYAYRNAFAHSDSLSSLFQIIGTLAGYSGNICYYFDKSIHEKIIDAITLGGLVYNKQDTDIILNEIHKTSNDADRELIRLLSQA